MTAVAYQMLPMLEAEAKERQRAHGGTAPGKPKEGTLVPKVEQVNEQPSRSVEQAAKAVGVSKQYVADMKTIAKKAPEKMKTLKLTKCAYDWHTVDVSRVSKDTPPYAPSISTVSPQKTVPEPQFSRLKVFPLKNIGGDTHESSTATLEQGVKKFMATTVEGIRHNRRGRAVDSPDRT